MSSTRDFKSPGIFAEDAATVIPPTPIAGVSYRDSVGGTDDTPNGWRYGTRVESQDFNQVMFLITSMLSMMDKQGVLGWSSGINYQVPAFVFGSDGLLYLALQASGPTSSPQDPTSSPLYWERFASHGMIAFTTLGVTNWTVPMAMRLGQIRPKVTVTGGGGGNQGTVGGQSSFGAFMTAGGGLPSVGGGGGDGGVASGGTINVSGGGGGFITGASGDGGGSFWGVSGASRTGGGAYGAGAGGSANGLAGGGAGATAIRVIDLTGVTSVQITVGAGGTSTATQPAQGVVVIEW